VTHPVPTSPAQPAAADPADLARLLDDGGRDWHPDSLAESYDVPPAFGHLADPRCEPPPTWLEDAHVLVIADRIHDSDPTKEGARGAWQ
jgi:hypothetical protein